MRSFTRLLSKLLYFDSWLGEKMRATGTYIKYLRIASNFSTTPWSKRRWFPKRSTILFIGFLLTACKLDEIQVSKDKLMTSPIGDGLNVDVYDFIGAEYLKENKMTGAELKALIADEQAIKASTEPMKPHAANIVEFQLSHILNALCLYDPYCIQIGLYNNKGVAFALSHLSFEAMFSYQPYEIAGIMDQKIRDQVVEKIQQGPLTIPTTLSKRHKGLHVIHGVCKLDDNRVMLCNAKSQKQDIIGFLDYVVTSHRPEVVNR